MTIIYPRHEDGGLGLTTGFGAVFGDVDFDQVARELTKRADAKTLLTPNATQRITLIVAGVYIVAIAILWCVFTFS